MSRSLQLFRLQQVDTKIDQVEKRLAEIEAVLGDNQAIVAAEATLETAKAGELQVEKTLGRAEEDVQGQQIKIEQNQAALYGGHITNPKELQDLQLEAGALQRHKESLEDVQLEHMLSLEEAQDQRQHAERVLEELRDQETREHGELIRERDKLLVDRQQLSSEREAASSGIPDEDTRLYLKLRQSKAGMAVSRVENKMCTACGTTLSESLAQAARSPNEISTCSNCRRILYGA
jgi:predicted  nucleic acid-binding Zn-ribbon protein